MGRNDRWLALVLVLVGLLGAWWLWQAPTPGSARSAQDTADPANPRLGKEWVAATSHYQITSRATMQQTAQVGAAAEALLRAYQAFFGLDNSPIPKGGLKLMLYRDQAQFKAHSQAPTWAEAYYRAPVCYAWYDASARNGYHWMLHEATHQLNNEVAHLAKAKWIDEGLASYFGTSVYEDVTLFPGRIDPNTYPVWWVRKLQLAGDAKTEFAAGRLVPLRALITGQGGPDIDRNVNAWYIGYWSLTHFLLHYENGRYAKGYRQLIAEGGSLADFERLIGPVERVQGEWYYYLGQLAAGQVDQNVIVVD